MRGGTITNISRHCLVDSVSILELSPFCCESMPPLLNVWAWHLRGEPNKRKPRKRTERYLLVKENKGSFKCLFLFPLLRFYYYFLVRLLCPFGTVNEIVLPCLRLNLLKNRDNWIEISML